MYEVASDVFSQRFQTNIEKKETDKLLNLVYQIAGLVNTNKAKIPVKTNILLLTYQNEQRKYERYKQQTKPKS